MRWLSALCLAAAQVAAADCPPPADFDRPHGFQLCPTHSDTIDVTALCMAMRCVQVTQRRWYFTESPSTVAAALEAAWRRDGWTVTRMRGPTIELFARRKEEWRHTYVEVAGTGSRLHSSPF